MKKLNFQIKLYKTIRILSAVGSILCGVAIATAHPSFAEELCVALVFLMWCFLSSNILVIGCETKKLQKERDSRPGKANLDE